MNCALLLMTKQETGLQHRAAGRWFQESHSAVDFAVVRPNQTQIPTDQRCHCLGREDQLLYTQQKPPPTPLNLGGSDEAESRAMMVSQRCPTAGRHGSAARRLAPIRLPKMERDDARRSVPDPREAAGSEPATLGKARENSPAMVTLVRRSLTKS